MRVHGSLNTQLALCACCVVERHDRRRTATFVALTTSNDHRLQIKNGAAITPSATIHRNLICALVKDILAEYCSKRSSLFHPLVDSERDGSG
jgi:hypothetical protein